MKTIEIIGILASVATIVGGLIGIFTLYGSRRTKKINFEDELRNLYIDWRKELDDAGINLDPIEGEELTKEERRKIRNYWPLVTLLEYEKLALNKIKRGNKLWKRWETNVADGIVTHKPILHEFCYYERYEDLGNKNKTEIIKIARRLYTERTGKQIDTEKILKEREELTCMNKVG